MVLLMRVSLILFDNRFLFHPGKHDANLTITGSHVDTSLNPTNIPTYLREG